MNSLFLGIAIRRIRFLQASQTAGMFFSVDRMSCLNHVSAINVKIPGMTGVSSSTEIDILRIL